MRDDMEYGIRGVQELYSAHVDVSQRLLVLDMLAAASAELAAASAELAPLRHLPDHHHLHTSG